MDFEGYNFYLSVDNKTDYRAEHTAKICYTTHISQYSQLFTQNVLQQYIRINTYFEYLDQPH